jgi:hypothetical protein
LLLFNQSGGNRACHKRGTRIREMREVSEEVTAPRPTRMRRFYQQGTGLFRDSSDSFCGSCLEEQQHSASRLRIEPFPGPEKPAFLHRGGVCESMLVNHENGRCTNGLDFPHQGTKFLFEGVESITRNGIVWSYSSGRP